ARCARLADVTGAVRFLEAELSDADAMRRTAIAAVPDVALHLAWSIGPDCYESPENVICVGGSLALLRGLVESGCARAVFVGTHLELAPSETILDEESPVAPRNLYATCKDAVHRIARSYLGSTDVSFAWTRLFNVYGPGQEEWALVPYIIRH